MKKSLIIAIEFESLAFFENALEIAGYEQLPLNATRFEGVSKRKPKLPF